MHACVYVYIPLLQKISEKSIIYMLLGKQRDRERRRGGTATRARKRNESHE